MTTQTPALIGQHAAWHVLSALPAGPAVDAAARVLLDFFAGRQFVWQPGLVRVAISPDVVRYARSGGHLRDSALGPVRAGLTVPEAAALALDLATDRHDRLSAAMNPAAGLSDGQLRSVAEGSIGSVSSGLWMCEWLHYSKVSPGRSWVARRACATVVDVKYAMLSTSGMYPYGEGPYDPEVLTPAMRTSWAVATPAVYREGAGNVSLSTARMNPNTFLVATAGPERVDEALDLCLRQHGRSTGGRMHVNPWLGAALLKRDFYNWDELLGAHGRKPVAGRLLGEELRRRVGDDPGVWTVAMDMLLGWDGTLVEWLETSAALK